MRTADIIFTIGSILFILALLPSVFSDSKPNKFTSALTGSVLLVFGLTYFSINFIYSGTTTLITSFLWYVLLFQVWKQDGGNTAQN